MTTSIAATAVKRVTPMLFVKDVSECLKFWEKLDFTATMQVPGETGLAFAAVQKDGTEIMYQSFESAENDATASLGIKGALRSSAFLYIEVKSLASVLNALRGVKPEVEIHETFYGATEIVVRDPGGHFVVFAEFKAQA